MIKLKNILSLFLILFFFLPLSANEAEIRELNKVYDLKKEIEEHYYSFSADSLQKILDECKLKITKSDDWHLKYYSALVSINLGKVVYNSDSDRAYDLFSDAIDNLLEVLEVNDSPEIKVLLSNAYGKKSSLSSFKAIYYGIKAKNWIEEAYEDDSNNPKTLLTAATHLMHTPAMYGGDKEEAKSMLNKSLKINRNFNDKDSLMIRWAEDAEVYAYLAQLFILEEKIDSAKIYMKKATDLVPNYGFVKHDLSKQINEL